MTTQRVSEEVAYTDLDAEMEQMRQFTEGVSTGNVDPTKGGNDPGDKVTPPADAPPEDDEVSDDLEEGEEDDGAELLDDEVSDEGEAEPAPVQSKGEIQFHEREVELMQRESAANTQSEQARILVRKQQLDQTQSQLIEAIKQEHGLDDAEAGKLALGVRKSWDAYYNVQDKAAEFQEWYRMGMRTSYILGQQYGVDPEVLFPPNPQKLTTFAEMKAKAEEVGGTSQLKKENQKLREAKAPRQQFARNRGTTSGRSHEQLVDSGLQKPEQERTSQEKDAIRREATGS